MRFSKVKSIKEIKSEPIYHLTVEKNHNFFANKICVHNCDYTGNIGVVLINHSDKEFTIADGERIAQMVIAKHETISWTSVDTLEQTERGEGGFGHTGVK